MGVAPIKVLIADDDAPTRILLRTAISQWGYEIVEAKDGEEAWKILQEQNAPQLLILDWLMPKIDGITLCEQCKNQTTENPPYIILLTQVSGNENMQKGIEAGADEFLTKPFNMADLRIRMSMGAKIIKYGNEILEKKNHLQAYQTKINKLAGEIKAIVDASLSDPSKLQESLVQINEIINEILRADEQGS